MIFRLLSKALGTLVKPILWGFDKSFNSIEKIYLAALQLALKVRIFVLVVVVAISLGSILLIPKLGMELIPDMSQGEFFVEVTLPTGSQLQQTDQVIADLASFTANLPGVARTYALAGTGSLLNKTNASGGDYWGKLNVVMQQGSTETVSQNAIKKMRDYLRKQPGLRSKFGKPELFTFATPLAIQIVGYDLQDLAKYSQQMETIMQSDKRFADVKSSLQSGNPELKIKFDHAKLAQLDIKNYSVICSKI